MQIEDYPTSFDTRTEALKFAKDQINEYDLSKTFTAHVPTNVHPKFGHQPVLRSDQLDVYFRPDIVARISKDSECTAHCFWAEGRGPLQSFDGFGNTASEAIEDFISTFYEYIDAANEQIDTFQETLVESSTFNME